MRIDRLTVRNFKKFEEQTFDFNKRFTLLVGENGAGKTSILDALAIAAGIWLVDAPDTTLLNSRRNILSSEILLTASKRGDRIQFTEHRPTIISATGRIGDCEEVTWTRQIRPNGKQTSNIDSAQALSIIADIYQRDKSGEDVLCPILAYYGAGRAWLPSNERSKKAINNKLPRRWDAFYDCFNERIRFAEMDKWFKDETTARVNNGGHWRPGFEAVKHAVLNCIHNADDVQFDGDRKQIVLSVKGEVQPFSNLSAGQRAMVALAADIAIKAVTQNAFLLSDTGSIGAKKILDETPGLVLIDELDVHLHPSWQRRVAADLKRTFPAVQFICTSHSPQVIGELSRDEVRLMVPNDFKRPTVAFGADSNWLLDHVMEGAASETARSRVLATEIEDAVEEGCLEEARTKLDELRSLIDGETGTVARMEGSLFALELLASSSSDDETADEND